MTVKRIVSNLAAEDVPAVRDFYTQLFDLDVAYPLTDEPWGVRRFYVRDPAGKLLNILSHTR